MKGSMRGRRMGDMIEEVEEIPSWGGGGYPSRVTTTHHRAGSGLLEKLRDEALHSIGIRRGSWSFLDHGSKTLVGRHLDLFLRTGVMRLKIVKNEAPNGQIVLSRITPSSEQIEIHQREVAERNKGILTRRAKITTPHPETSHPPWWTGEYETLPRSEQTRMGVERARGETEKKWTRPLWGRRSEGDDLAINERLKERVLKRLHPIKGSEIKKLPRKYPNKGRVLGHRKARRSDSGGYDLRDENAAL